MKALSFFSAPVVGADVGEQLCAGSEAAGAAAQGGRPAAQRDGRVAEHAQLDLQTPPPVLPPQSVLQEESTQAGTKRSNTRYRQWLGKALFLFQSVRVFVGVFRESCTSACLKNLQIVTPTSPAWPGS